MPSLVKVLKYAGLLVAVALWTVGLVDQFGSFDLMARYVAVSAAMVAVAMV
jgi:hypothetical protein